MYDSFSLAIKSHMTCLIHQTFLLSNIHSDRGPGGSKYSMAHVPMVTSGGVFFRSILCSVCVFHTCVILTCSYICCSVVLFIGAVAIGDLVKSTLGPKGMVSSTNDCYTPCVMVLYCYGMECELFPFVMCCSV